MKGLATFYSPPFVSYVEAIILVVNLPQKLAFISPLEKVDNIGIKDCATVDNSFFPKTTAGLMSFFQSIWCQCIYKIRWHATCPSATHAKHDRIMLHKECNNNMGSICLPWTYFPLQRTYNMYRHDILLELSDSSETWHGPEWFHLQRQSPRGWSQATSWWESSLWEFVASY